jgi:hypothetical protein
MSTYTFWNLDSVQQSRIPAGNVTQSFSMEQGSLSVSQQSSVLAVTCRPAVPHCRVRWRQQEAPVLE